MVCVTLEIDESSSRAKISRYELGVNDPRVLTAKLIADAFDVLLIFL